MGCSDAKSDDEGRDLEYQNYPEEEEDNHDEEEFKDFEEMGSK